MPKITVLPNEELCPEGAQFDVKPGSVICEALLEHGIEIDNACAMSCACTTCHVIVREGFNSLIGASDQEEDFLGMAWGLEPHSRLGCQARVASTNLVIEIPRYTINMVKEDH
jgi:2Fe-2S ferredoxin